MSRPRWLAVVATAGLALVLLSFVDQWIVHHRELRGEGYREVLTTVGAWNAAAVPVVSLGVVAALATAGAALAAVRRGSALPAWALPIGSVLTLCLVGVALVPIGQDGHASSIDLTPGWAAFVGAGLAASMTVAAVRLVQPGRGHSIALVGLGAVLVAGGVGGRWLALQLRAAPGEAWATGTYTRSVTDGPAAEALTLTVADGQFEIADRWSGNWESRSWTVILLGDPACPETRGTYHAHNVGPDARDLRFVKVVDTCAGGARAADLEAGLWERDP